MPGGITTTSDENLALGPGVRVRVSVPHPTGRGARDPGVLLNETALELDGQPLLAFLQNRQHTYDTYDGHNAANGPDWYAIEFPQAQTFNTVEMTMECPHRDGGWWTALHVEVRPTSDAAWIPVSELAITPPYKFDDVSYGRPPYETHALTFDETTAQAVRVIGKPGGLAQFTSVARLAVYRRDLSRWNPTSLPAPPVPYVFKLISPKIIWDLSESLIKLTGLSLSLPLMDHYLDARRYQKWWQRISRNYQGEPELWFLLGDRIGWSIWSRLEQSDYETEIDSLNQTAPYVRLGFYGTTARAVAPIIVGNQVLAELITGTVIVKDRFDVAWHKVYATQNSIPWSEYEAAIGRSPHLTLEQLEGAASLMGMIANTIVDLAHTNLSLARELDTVRQSLNNREQERRDIVQRAIDHMQLNLENEVTVHDVAQAVALSPTYLGVLFRQEMGLKPSEFLINLRLERAKECLAHTQMSVTDICTLLGYDPSYFSRLFKRHTGYTPREYMDKMRPG